MAPRSRATAVPTALPRAPLTFAHEAALAVVHDLAGDQGVVGHGVVPHGCEAAVLLQRQQRLRLQRNAQECAEALRCATQVLGTAGEMEGWETGTGDVGMGDTGMQSSPRAAPHR